MTFGDNARRWAAEGYAIFPVDREKKPLTAHGFEDASTDTAQIDRWEKQHPSAKVGIACGASGIVVVDLDVKRGVDGPGNWAALEAPVSRAVFDTPSGGQHSYYSDPDGSWTNSQSKIAPGVDVRAVGGYVVAYGDPPARDTLPALPIALRPSEPQREPVPADSLTVPYAVASLGLAIADLRSCPAGERNGELNRVAFSLGRFVAAELLDESLVRNALYDAAQANGLLAEDGERSVLATIDSGLRSGMALVEKPARPDRLFSGRDALFGPESEMPLLWGPDGSPLWAEGESLMLFGPPGSGKSTLAQNLVVARLGGAKEVLGSPVKDDGGLVLYLGMDRPAQVTRSMRRMFAETDLTLDRLQIWKGPLERSITDLDNRDYLADFAQKLGATTVVIDSLKDILPNASDESAAGAYNSARQELLARGIQLAEIHHNRKANGDNRIPRRLDDVYGNRYLTAGAGSILCLWTKEPEDPDIELFHVKTLMEPYRHRIVRLDKESGTFNMPEAGSDVATILMLAPNGMTPAEVTQELYGRNASNADKERVKKQLQRLATKQEIRKMDGGRYGA